MREEEFYSGREQTYIKHFFLEKYLEKVAYKIGSFNENFAFVDGFSGPWRTSDEAFEDTSFMIAIRKLRQVREGLEATGRAFNIKCVFVEKDPVAYKHLQSAVADIQDVEILTINGEFEDSIQDIVKEIQGRFALSFIDPTGWTGYSLNKISPLLNHKPGEVIINFMFDHINRFADHSDPRVAQGLNDLFGTDEWRDFLSSENGRESALVERYSKRIEEVGGYRFVAHTEVKKPLLDRTYFHLIYGTRHPQGILEFRAAEKMSAMEQEAVRAGAKLRDKTAKTGQSDLFGVSTESTADIFEKSRAIGLTKIRPVLIEYLQTKGNVKYLDAAAHVMSMPRIWESDFKDLVIQLRDDGLIKIVGMTEKQRKPNKDHLLRYVG